MRAPADRPLVLAVYDEPRIAEVVSLTLEDDGFHVATASGGEEALRSAAELDPDLVVLDLMMPGMDGQEVMRRLHARKRTPVILLTARGDPADRRRGLDLGADDYVVKPFHADELAARVRAVLRRSNAEAARTPDVMRVGDVEVDLERRLITKRGEPVVLSRIEWLVLQHLARNPGKVVLHSDLLGGIWGSAYADDVQVLRVCVSRLRAKLGSGPGRRGFIRTYVGVGYALQTDDGEVGAARRTTSRREETGVRSRCATGRVPGRVRRAETAAGGEDGTTAPARAVAPSGSAPPGAGPLGASR